MSHWRLQKVELMMRKHRSRTSNADDTRRIRTTLVFDSTFKKLITTSATSGNAKKKSRTERSFLEYYSAKDLTPKGIL